MAQIKTAQIKTVQLAFMLCLPQLLLAQLQGPEAWEAELYRSHSLVGSIYDTASDALISTEVLADGIGDARYLLLGEKHDNPDHHRLQRHVLQFLVEGGRLDNITFEMMDATVRERLIDLSLQPGMSDEELKTYLLWDEEGWDWRFYGPLIQFGYQAGIALSAGNIPGSQVSEIYARSEGDGNQVLNEEMLGRLTDFIDESHCGLLPESQFPAMVRVQQARDRAMARALRRPEAGTVSVLIAGNFHVREDLGVPNYLKRREPGINDDELLSLAFLEVSEQSEDPRDYLESAEGPEGADDTPEYDYIWFTPAVSNEDYCDSLR